MAWIIGNLTLDMAARRQEYPPAGARHMPCGFSIADMEDIISQLRGVMAKLEEEMKQLLVGIGHDPAVVGAMRALVIYALPVAVGLVVAYLQHVSDPRWMGIAVALVPVLRAVEGAVDRALRPTQNDVYPRPPAGAQ